MIHTFSIRRSLLASILLVILLLSGASMLSTYSAARSTVFSMSRAMIVDALNETEARLDGFFKPVIDELMLAHTWGRSGMLDKSDHAAMGRLFVPVVQYHPQISALLLADERGDEMMLLRDTDRFRIRLTQPARWGERSQWLGWHPDGKSPAEWQELGYDPRQRPWFKGAIQKFASTASAPSAPATPTQIHWTAPYTFFTNKVPGITAAIAYRSQNGPLNVVGFDILLEDISRFTQELRVAQSGMVAVLTEDNQVIGLPRHPRLDDAAVRKSMLLNKPSELGVPEIYDAAQAYLALAGQSSDPFRFTSGDTLWWAGVSDYQLGAQRKLRIAVMVPESDLLGDITSIRTGIILSTLFVVLVAVLITLVLANLYSRPIEALVRESRRISHGDLEPGETIRSRLKEVLQLVVAHNHMRAGLKSLFKLERDLQLARQIQESTFPASLPETTGFAIDGWSEPAEETGADTYDVIGYNRDESGQVALTLQQPQRVFMLLADATGHGIGPALSATQVRAMLRMAVRAGLEAPAIVCQLNEQLGADLHGGRFVTAWFGDLDVASATLTSFSAGQAPLLCYRAASSEVAELPADAPPLGVVPDIGDAAAAALVLQPGDIFVVISDGVFEAKNSDGEAFGIGRIKTLLRDHAAAGPDEISAVIRAGLDAHTGSQQAVDDRTAIIIKRL